ncbi:hypothetical protein DEO72_LG8g3041 [Vigna unguiculata]|uniref:Uncharacterized protein n=1 Tax=Vigna unguiculata TaxID=3917 RepID=A0A4D6MXW7_VIGUN|nr:hypothetical protein DEO72_LG8g3041 [Vigna unguiculata]
MAVVGPSGKEVFLELRRKKLEEEKRKGGESASRVPAEMTSQKGDLMPPAAKKSKRRDCTARPSTPRSSSPKKSRGASLLIVRLTLCLRCLMRNSKSTKA